MKTPDSIHCRPGTTDAMQRLADENEALRAERDKLAANLQWTVNSLPHIRAAGAREALERAMEETGFSGTIVRVDVMREIIEQMEGEV